MPVISILPSLEIVIMMIAGVEFSLYIMNECYQRGISDATRLPFVENYRGAQCSNYSNIDTNLEWQYCMGLQLRFVPTEVDHENAVERISKRHVIT